jgi:hypothetical protein
MSLPPDSASDSGWYLPMRVLPPAGAAALAVAATVLLAPAASAHTNAPGDNGTVKIHDAKTGEELVKDETHVCTFYVDAFFFDGQQEADWSISRIPPSDKDEKGTVVKQGKLFPDGAGHGRTPDMGLPDGHYRLKYQFTDEHGNAKFKNFWTDCPAEGSTTGSPTGGTTGNPAGGTTGSTTDGSTAGTTAGTTGGTATGGTTGGTTAGSTGGTTTGSSGGTTTGGTPSVSATSSAPAASAGGNSSDDGSKGGSLASTGASVIGISAAAAVLLAVGAAFRFRRRAGRQH